MEEIKLLSDDVIEQIKDYNHENLTKEQESLIDKLILDDELKQFYKEFGLCDECKQPMTSDTYHNWCRICNAKRFQQNFKNWTSGNNDVDKFIQKTQLKAKIHYEILEWIEYDRFEDIKYLAEGGFGTVYKATWTDGPIKDSEWSRQDKISVALKSLHNSANITAEFLKEVRYFFIILIALTFYEY